MSVVPFFVETPAMSRQETIVQMENQNAIQRQIGNNRRRASSFDHGKIFSFFQKNFKFLKKIFKFLS